MKRWLLIGVLVVLGSAALGTWFLLRPHGPGAGERADLSGLVLRAADGSELRLERYAGQVLLLVFGGYG